MMRPLHTERLHLRAVVPDDLDDIFAIVGDPEAMRHMPKVYSREEAETLWLGGIQKRYDEHGYSFYAVTSRESGQFYGLCGLLEQEVVVADQTLTLTEIGYHFKRSHWGNGYATESAIACRDHAFDNLDRSRVVSLISRENVPSQKVALRNGMTVWKRDVLIRGFTADMYSITREERDMLRASGKAQKS
jgi:RimJ/RimL family protein N-acetyltransferase